MATKLKIKKGDRVKVITGGSKSKVVPMRLPQVATSSPWTPSPGVSPERGLRSSGRPSWSCFGHAHPESWRCRGAVPVWLCACLRKRTCYSARERRSPAGNLPASSSAHGKFARILTIT